MALLGIFLAVLVVQPAAGAGEDAGCLVPPQNVILGMRKLPVEVKTATGPLHRHFLLYVPRFYAVEKPLPLYILPPGAFNSPEKQSNMSEAVKYAEQQQVVYVILQAQDNLLNVVKKAHAVPKRWDDVAYTKAVVERVQQELCIDPRRIFCLGYSRGARFCCRLASEYSEVIAGIAPISGLRFPRPPNMTRPIPIITFHGTNDPINPFGGMGDKQYHANPEYWYDSVWVAVKRWVEFNQCTQNITYRLSEGVTIYSHTSCKENADVIFVKIDKGGHVWPGSMFPFSPSLHMVTHEVNASVMIGSFFAKHPMPGASSGGASSDERAIFNPLTAFLGGLVLGIIVMMLAWKIIGSQSGEDDSDESDDESFSEKYS